MTSQSDSLYSSKSSDNELFDVLDDMFFFLVNNYHKEILPLIDGLIDNMNISEEIKEAIFPQLFWWATFCFPIGMEQTTIYQCYLQNNKEKLEGKSAWLQELLVSWQHLNPGFYYVNGSEIKVRGVYYLRDIFEKDVKLLTVNRALSPPPKPGELLIGLLLPLGNNCFTTLSALYPIPKRSVTNIVQDIIPQYEHHADYPNYRFNPQLYPYLIKRTLEIINANEGGDPYNKN